MDSTLTLESGTHGNHSSRLVHPDVPHVTPPSTEAVESKKRHNHPSAGIEHTILPTQRRIQRPLSTYTSLGSPIGRTHPTISIGNGTTAFPCLQSRSRSNSLQNHYGGPMAYGGTLLPQIEMPRDDMEYTSYNPNHTIETKMNEYDSTNASTINIVPLEILETRKAMEAACASERKRAKELEVKEQDMTADELRQVLKQERARTGKIQSDLAALRYGSIQSQFQAEVLEEGRINGLMRRLDFLQEEKGRIINELEREEEMLTNTLQRKLDEVRREKAILQNQIEKEIKAHRELENELNTLRNASGKINAEKADLSVSKVEEEMEEEE